MDPLANYLSDNFIISTNHIIAMKYLTKRTTSKIILKKFMMRKNIVMKDLMKKNTTKVILNQFIGGRNLMYVNIVTKDLMKNKT